MENELKQRKVSGAPRKRARPTLRARPKEVIFLSAFLCSLYLHSVRFSNVNPFSGEMTVLALCLPFALYTFWLSNVSIGVYNLSSSIFYLVNESNWCLSELTMCRSLHMNCLTNCYHYLLPLLSKHKFVRLVNCIS